MTWGNNQRGETMSANQTTDLAHIAPKGSRQHDQIKRAKLTATRNAIERLLGPAHSEGDGTQITAEWFLVTDCGTVTIYNHWSFNEDEYGIDAAGEDAALLAVTWLKTNKIDAYCLTGSLI